MRGNRWIGAAALGVVAAPGFAQAPAAPPPAPPPIAPAPTREEVERARPPAELAPPSRLTVRGGVERAPCALDEPRFADVTVTLGEVRFANLRGLTADDLRPSYAEFLGRRVPIATVCQIRDSAATILRRAGYVAAVQVPPQTISGGVVTFDVLMARLVGVRVRGNAGRSERLIARYLAKLQAEEVFNEHTAERYMLLARDLPGYEVSLTLRPAGAPGDVIGEVTALRTPVIAEVNVQNLGTKSVGRFGALATLQLNDLAGAGDRLTLGVFNTVQPKEQTVVTGGYDLRIGGEGLTLTGRATHAWTHPDAGATDPLRSRTFVGTLEAAYPFVRTQRANLRGAIGLDVIEQRLRFNAVPLTRDKVRVAYLRIDGDATDRDSYVTGGRYTPNEPRWRGYYALEARRGLGVLGASQGCGAAPFYTRCSAPGAVSLSRIEADPTATVLRFTGQAEFRPAPKVVLLVQPRFQYSPDPLVSYEEYSAGNYTAGRGYDPGTIVGDSGVGFQSEFRLGSSVPRTERSLAVQPFAFFDAAKVWNRDSPIPSSYPERLYSVGGGIRAVYGNRARIDLIIAQPLTRAGFQTKRGDPRVLLTLTTRIVPWRGL